MRKVFLFCRANWDALLIVMFAFGIATFDVFDMTSPQVVATTNLAVLGLLAVELMLDREGRKRLEQRLQLFTLEKMSSIDQLHDRERPENLINLLITNAQEEIWVLHETGYGLLDRQFDILEAAIQRGVKIGIVTTRGFISLCLKS